MTATTARNVSRPLTWALLLSPVAVVLAGLGIYFAMMMGPPPADLDLGRTQASAQGTFIATIEPGMEPLAINRIHNWIIEVRMTGGAAVPPEAITVDGGMPQHGHGLPTAPKVTTELGNGRFMVEGMKFNMPGWWVVNVHVGGDTATFNLTL